MKSPFTGGACTLKHEVREITYRKETYQYMAQYWVCNDTNEEFTTSEQDEASISQVYNQYRAKYGIPFPDEIRSIRERYGLSASKMSLILGLGDNQYRLYENGEVPNLSNGKMIRTISSPEVMLEYVKSSRNQLSENDFQKIKNRLQDLIDHEENEKFIQYETRRIFSSLRSADNGFAAISLSRLQNLLLLILNQCGEVWCTKMNKLLFYIDFLSYRERGMAISGLTYRALDYGPVPERWDRVYSQFDSIHQEPRTIHDFDGSVLMTESQADPSLFIESELSIINTICDKFKNSSSRDLSKLSHEEEAWKNFHTQGRRIPFDLAFSLRAV